MKRIRVLWNTYFIRRELYSFFLSMGKTKRATRKDRKTEGLVTRFP